MKFGRGLITRDAFQAKSVLEVGVGPYFPSEPLYRCSNVSSVVAADLLLPVVISSDSRIRRITSDASSLAAVLKQDSCQFDFLIMSKVFNRMSIDQAKDLLVPLLDLDPGIILIEEYKRRETEFPFLGVDSLSGLFFELTNKYEGSIYRSSRIFAERYYEGNSSFRHRMRNLIQCKRDVLVLKKHKDP